MKIEKRMHRDNLLSVLIGPVKYLVPILSYIILYPLIISRAGIEVVGLWSLTASIISFVSVSDIGFSQLLIRESGLDRAKFLQDVHSDYLTAQRAYIILLLILLFAFYLGSNILLQSVGNTYSLEALKFSVFLLLGASVIQLLAKLDSAILTARHDNYFVQIVAALSPVFTYIFAIAGAFYDRPIEGFALGTLLSSFANFLVFRGRISRNHQDWLLANADQRKIVSMQRFFSLIRRGWYLYSCSMGMLVRGPIFRLIIASVAGLQAAAIFDIAIRVSQTLRDVIATGFSVLYPSFASLYRNGELAKIVELIQISLYVLLPIGGLLLGLLVGSVNHLFMLWLGDYPVLLPAVTQILAIWQVMTLLNVPFWHLLQATHNEYIAAWSIWAHTVAIILLLPLSLFIEIGVVGLVSYWVISSILTQGLIYFSVHTKLKLLWVSINCSRLLYMVTLVIVFLLLTCWISQGNMNLIEVMAYLTLVGLIYSIASVSIVYRVVYDFLRR